jgi:hypothetical protein
MKKSRFPLFIFFLILIMPRVTLMSIGGSSLRVEDILIVVNFLWLLSNHRDMNLINGVNKKVISSVLLISALGVVIAIYSSLTGKNSLGIGILYSLRPLEYVSIIPTVFYLAREYRNQTESIIYWFTLTTCTSAVLQEIFGYKFGVDRFGYSRASGLTGGPYELAMIGLVLIFFWLEKKRYNMALLSFIAVLISSSRISSVALLISGFYFFYQKKKNNDEIAPTTHHNLKTNLIAPLFLTVAVLASVGIFTLNNQGLNEQIGNYKDRIISTDTSGRLFQDARNLADSVPSISISKEYNFWVFQSPPNFLRVLTSSDASTARRYFVWTLVVDTVINHSAVLLGLGPGFFGSAVDSNYVRIFGELGVLGLLLYGYWLRILWRNGKFVLRSQILALCITAIYIDIFVSLKPIILIYLMFVLFQRSPDSRIV